MDLYQAAGLTGQDSFDTHRLRIRPLKVEDAPAIADGMSAPQVSRFMPAIPKDYRLRDAESFIAGVQSEHTRDWAVWRDGALIGGLSFNKELGFWLRPEHWGQSLAFELGHALLSRWFLHPQASPAHSSYHRGNEGSRKVQSRLGFAPVGGQEIDHTHTLLTPEQWHALNPWIVETERLRLAPLTANHAAEFAAWTGAPEIARMTGSILPDWTPDQAAAWIEQRRWCGRPGFVLGIWLKGEDEMIGQVGMSDDIGYMIVPAHWGQGFAFEAARGLLDAAFPRFGLDEVVASAFHDNPASMRVLDKLGFDKIEEKQVQVPARLEPAMISKYRLINPQGKHRS